MSTEIARVLADGRARLGDDPGAAERIGRQMALSIRPAEASIVLHWAGDADSVLAHVVARELNVARVCITIDEGLMYFSSPLPEACSAALVGFAFTADRPATAIGAYLESRGHRLARTADVAGLTES
ncbi:MAG: hypothetical protein JWL94_452 [Microbacteriaceae bacterium]|jgi:hypothetical protein|nr:hypothetical protein [Microbacteriaceae bacterium]HEV7956657.1 hypothetical protein [Marisediminicola sp.]